MDTQESARDTRRPGPRPPAALAWPRYWPCNEGYVDLDCPVEEEFGYALAAPEEGGRPCSS